MTEKTNNTKTYYKYMIPTDWDVMELGQICKVNQGLQIPIEERLKHYEPNSKIYITIQYLNNGKEKEFIKNYSENVCCVEDDILMTRTGNTGIVIYGVNGVFHNNFFKINHNKEIVDRNYLIEFLQSDKTKHDILVKAGTSTIPDLNHKDFYKIKAIIPPLPEQKAIAHILGLMDTAINKNNQLIAQKELRKKWLMQNLLTGKKRLNGFEKDKWKEVKLSDFSINRNSSLSINNLEGNNGFYSLYGANRIIQKINFYESEDAYVSIIKDGAGVGRVFLCEEKSSVVGTMAYIKPNENSTLHFLYYLLHTIKFENFITGSTIPHIYYSKYSKTIFKLPTLKEQTAIAQVLQAADKEIQLLKTKTEKLKEQKKGLMQVLLTGKKRLIIK